VSLPFPYPFARIIIRAGTFGYRGFDLDRLSNNLERSGIEREER